MICAQCGATNEAGRKFCLECGARLVISCAVCRTPNTPGARFCGECGSPIAEAAAGSAAGGGTVRGAAAATPMGRYADP